MSEKTGHRTTSEGLSDQPSGAKQTPGQERLRLYEFGPFRLDPTERTLLRGNEIVPLTPKAFDTLYLLVRNSGHMLEKDEMIRALWPDTFVEEGSLSNNIFLLRKALGENPSFIETVPRRGYRFVGAVLQLPHAALPLLEEPSADHPELAKQRSRGSGPPLETGEIPGGETKNGLLRWLLPGTAALAALLTTAIWYLHRPLPPPKITGYTQITHDGQFKGLMGTDGSRLYFNRLYPSSIAQVGIANGEIEPIPIPFPVSLLFDVSPEGSSLLVSSSDSGDESTAFESGRSSLWSVQLPGGSLRHLTHGAIVGAAWSPDGESVVYSTREGDIFVMRNDGTHARTLIASQGQTPNSFKGLLSWSPDGKKIQFSEGGRLWEMSSDGSGLRQLLPDWHPSTFRCCGRWTPDGRFFLFLSRDSVPKNGLHRSRNQIWALDERRSLFRQAPVEPIQLTSTPTSWSLFVPSKDGKSIFAESVIPRGELVRYDVRSHQLEPYLGGISAEFLTFSPDGKFVAYVTFPEGILWRANRDGSNPMQLTEAPWYPMVLRWSPDGTQILFMGPDSEDQFKGYIISAQGGIPRPILPEDTGSQSDPTWSPDGSKIGFSSQDFNRPTTNIAIRVLDLASHQVNTLPGSDDTMGPRWSPNGRFIAALTYSSRDLKVFDFETQRWTVFQKGETGFPEWSRDGKLIYFLRPRGNWGVYRIRPSGGDAERIVDLKGFRFTGAVSFWMGLDPEDTPLLLRDTGTSEIYALSLEEK